MEDIHDYIIYEKIGYHHEEQNASQDPLKARSRSHNLTIEIVQVDLRFLRPHYTEDRVNPMSFECVWDY